MPTTAAPSLPLAAAADAEDFPDPDDEALDVDFASDLQEGMAALMGGLGPDEEAEFRSMMAQMMQGGASGGAGQFDPAALLAAMGGPPPPAPAAVQTTGQSTKDIKGKAKSTPSVPATFQDTIASAMNKMKDSSTTMDAETEAKTASEVDPLAAMMAQMAGLGDMGGEEGLQGMLDEVMDQLMSRELLYEPLKELANKVSLNILLG